MRPEPTFDAIALLAALRSELPEATATLALDGPTLVVKLRFADRWQDFALDPEDLAREPHDVAATVAKLSGAEFRFAAALPSGFDDEDDYQERLAILRQKRDA